MLSNLSVTERDAFNLDLVEELGTKNTPAYTFKRVFDALDYRGPADMRDDQDKWICEATAWLALRNITHIRISDYTEPTPPRLSSLYIEGWYNQPIDQGPEPWKTA
jgi:hypothetical protein